MATKVTDNVYLELLNMRDNPRVQFVGIRAIYAPCAKKSLIRCAFDFLFKLLGRKS